MSNIDKLLILTLMLYSFMLGMILAYYDAVILKDPPIHYSIESRYLNFTEKNCYTQSDVELIVFGKVLDHE